MVSNPDGSMGCRLAVELDDNDGLGTGSFGSFEFSQKVVTRFHVALDRALEFQRWFAAVPNDARIACGLLAS